jgi:hypothetical protein
MSYGWPTQKPSPNTKTPLAPSGSRWRRKKRRDCVMKIGILHAGKSQFELNIEEKRRQRLEEVARKAEEKEQQEREMEEKLATGEYVRTPTGTQLMKPGQTTYIDVFGREQVSRRKEEMEKYNKAAQLTDAVSEEELLAKTTLVGLTPRFNLSFC